MSNNCPKPLNRAQQAMILHTLRVPVVLDVLILMTWVVPVGTHVVEALAS